MWVALLQGFSFSSAPLLGLSPFKVFVFSSALRAGWRKTLPLALAPLIADIPIVLLLLLIIGQMPDTAIIALRFLGGLYYIYLAVTLTRRASSTVVDTELIEQAPQRTFWQAITAVWITPAVYINWSVIGIPALLAYLDQSPFHAAAFVLGFYLLWVGGLAIQIVVFGQAGKLNQTATRYLVIAAALLLIGFGIYQCWIGITEILAMQNGAG
jgi:arginine exporter protein ArgO